MRPTCSATRIIGSGSAGLTCRGVRPRRGRAPAILAANLVGGQQHGRRSFHRRLLHRRLPAQLPAVADSHPGHRHWGRGGGASQGRPVLRAGDAACAGGYRGRFFSKDAHANLWQARPVLTGMVGFRPHNLLDPLRERPFDVVFLKNVLIYFAPASKKKVVENVRSLIAARGLLVAGPAEGIGDLLKDYVRLQPWLYQRPNEIAGTDHERLASRTRKTICSTAFWATFSTSRTSSSRNSTSGCSNWTSGFTRSSATTRSPATRICSTRCSVRPTASKDCRPCWG